MEFRTLVEESLDFFAEVSGPEGLGDEAIRSSPFGGGCHFRLSVGGDNYDANVGCGGITSQLPQNFPSVDSGQSNIEKNDVVQFGSGRCQAGNAILGTQHAKAKWPDAHLNEAPHARRIFNYEHCGGHFGRSRVHRINVGIGRYHL